MIAQTSERLIHNGSPDDSLSSTISSTDDSKSKSSDEPEEQDMHNEMATGQAALDRLLASLAIESDLMEQESTALSGGQSDGGSSTSTSSGHIHRNHINGHRTANSSSSESSFGRRSHSPNDGNIFRYPSVPKQTTRDFNHNHTSATTIRRTTARQPTNSNGIHSNLDDVLESLTDFSRNETLQRQQRHANNGFQSHRTTVQRLASESEDHDSSAYSPSLSDRSNINGMVSWSDQVECICWLFFNANVVYLATLPKQTPQIFGPTNDYANQIYTYSISH